MKRLDFRIRIFPGRLTQRINNQWYGYKDNAPQDQYGKPYGITSGCNLRRWDKALYECQQGTQETDACHYPDQAVSFPSDSERTIGFGHFVP